MSTHEARIRWTRDTESFAFEEYSRTHTWRFPGGVQLTASSAPDYLGDPARMDPEEAFVGALASCHMLTFLAIASKRRWVVDRYEDPAVGHMEKNEDGKLAITRVVLRPEVDFSGERRPTADEIERMHDLAHEHCFIANSVRTRVRIEHR